MSPAIVGLGTALPLNAIAQSRVAELISALAGHTGDQARRLSILYRRTGIEQRHVALDHLQLRPAGDDDHGPTTRWRMNAYEDQARLLAVRAAGPALDSAGLEPGAVTHLVTVSCTGFTAPGFDLALIEALGLSPDVPRTHVGFMGCHGALNGLRVARAFLGAEPGARVLLCAVELCTLHFRYGREAELSVANALFADGAAALVATADGPADAWKVAACGSHLVAETQDAMTWRIGDHGFEMTLSPRVSALIGDHLRPWLTSWLGRSGVPLDGVASWAVHPGGPRILDAVEAALGLDPTALDDSRAVLAACGNMSSPTLLFILDRLRRRDAPRPCVALGFGPGLAIEAVLFQ